MKKSLSSFPTKVLLIVPRATNSSFFYAVPNLGIGYVGASLLRCGHNVKVVDLNLFKQPLEFLKSQIEQMQPDIVGITCFSFQYASVIEYLKLIKSIKKDIITVLGGSHASSLAKEIITIEQNLDYVICGEGELSFSMLIENLYKADDLNKIPGLVFRESDMINSNNQNFIQNLDNLEYPWKVINPLDYQSTKVHGFTCREKPIAPVISSRGCPYLCGFCAGRTVQGSKIRLRTPVKFVDEIEFLNKEFGIKEIQIADDNFTFNKEHAIEICNKIINRKLKIAWSLPNGVRADKLDEELLQTMKAAGCYYLAFGIEFGSKRILEITKKSLNLDNARFNIRLANQLGFITQAFFLMGHPEEKKEDILETEKFALSVPLDKVVVNIPFPYPGTELFGYYIKNRYQKIELIDWQQFKESGYNYIFEHLTLKYVLQHRKKLNLKFYLNPFRMARFLLKFKTLTQFKSAFNGLLVLVQYFRGKR